MIILLTIVYIALIGAAAWMIINYLTGKWPL